MEQSSSCASSGGSVPTIDDFRATYSVYKKHGNQFDKFCEALDSPDPSWLGKVADRLAKARSCLTVGPGTGQVELAFIVRLMPGLQRLTAVEPDAASVAELRVNMQRHLPSVGHVVHVIKVEDCADVIKDQFDVVLLFSVMTLIERDFHSTLCRTLLPRWTSPHPSEGGSPGLVVFSMMSQTHRPDSLQEILNRLNPAYRVPTYEDIESLLVGGSCPPFQTETEFEIRYAQDLSQVDDGVVRLYRRLVGRPDLQVDDVQRAVLEVWPDGASDQRFHKFGFYSRAT